ncbi:uncharacterized protein LOC131299553 [Rhododendron vialii]|uniref:uncharacterized protein LOC131299553 n=1 Tax=Rhododendron vialii TaxID=182163 RepID=UPI00265EDCDE|nr:uncharacterized protein LOC131299553 [Rhododendron vialii]
MDKGWISLPRLHPTYIQGVKDFVKYACGINPNSNEIMCPCKKCRNVKLVKKEVLGEHLMIDGFLPSYTCWIFHGEFVASPVARTEDKGQSDSYEGDEMHELLYDAFGIPPFVPPTNGTTGSSSNYGPDEKTKKFFSLLKEAERELYPGCSKFSTLSFIVRLLHIKTLSGWTDKSFTMLLELLKEAFPEGDTLPKSFYATRVLLKDLGLDYHKVDACPKDCSLYWKDTADRDNCIVCHHPRYKQFEKEEIEAKKKQKKIPHKIVRYFPLIPSLQRLFMTSETASLMKWHAAGQTNDRKMRHPADTPVWKHYDNLYPDFACEPRNVRLGLASDGFNPFKSMSISYSVWPVILTPYNLPPWLCMKQPYMFLTLLIDGPNGPGD